MRDSHWLPLVIMLAVLAGSLLSVEAGFRFGRRGRPSETDRGLLGAVQGAILGMLGLLLGFSFAGATQRFAERQELIVREANAIGTAYLRAEVLDAARRDALRAALRDYTAERIRAFGPGMDADDRRAAVARCEALHHEIWRAAREGIEARPALAAAVLPAVNEVIDLHAVRMAAARRHLPGLVAGLLMGCAALSLMTIGYGFGLTRRRHPELTGTLAVVIACAVWITLDLDHPRLGLIRLDDRPLEELRFEAPPGP